MNWTSTRVPLWQLDCQNFWRAGTAFEIRDVKEEDRQFIEAFAASHHLSYTRRGDSVIFQAPNFSQPENSRS